MEHLLHNDASYARIEFCPTTSTRLAMSENEILIDLDSSDGVLCGRCFMELIMVFHWSLLNFGDMCPPNEIPILLACITYSNEYEYVC